MASTIYNLHHDSMLVCNLGHSFSLEYHHWSELQSFASKHQHNSCAILLIPGHSNLSSFLSRVVDCVVRLHVKCQWHFVHVCNNMQCIIVLFAKIYNKMMELGDLLLVIFWKSLSEGCLLSKREAILLHKMLAPVP